MARLVAGELDVVPPRIGGIAVMRPAPRSAPASPAKFSCGWSVVALVVLWAATFRSDLASIIATASEFSDWTHVFVFPIVAATFLWCRREELRGAAVAGSWLGLPLVCLAALL